MDGRSRAGRVDHRPHDPRVRRPQGATRGQPSADGAVKLLRGGGPVLRIGHRGAAALAPANTIQAVEAALAQGVDLVELDVFGRPDRTLVLGHSRKELGEEPVTIEDVFAFLAETAPDVGLLADMKGAGWEAGLVEALRRHDLVERSVASTSNVGTLQRLRRLEPRLGRSRTYPRGRLSSPGAERPFGSGTPCPRPCAFSSRTGWPGWSMKSGPRR